MLLSRIRMSEQIQYEFKKYFKRCYSLTETDIKKIANLIKQKSNKDPDISVEMKDSGKISASSVEAAINDSVLEGSSIKELNISARNYNSKIELANSISINVESSFSTGPIRVSISGTKDFVYGSRAELENLIRSTQRWYWPLNYSGNFAVQLVYFCVYAFLAFMCIAFGLVYIELETAKKWPNVLSGGITLGIAFVVFLLYVLKGFVFPSISIRLGRSARIAERQDQIRKYVLGTIISGAVISIFQNQLWEWLKPHLWPVS